MRGIVAGLILFFLSAWSTDAAAATAYTRSNVNLRTGPDSGYPVVGLLPAGMRVDIYGCVDDWAWCDVSTGRDRGWVSSGYLGYDYQGGQVVVYDYGPNLGLPVLAFVLGTYWDSHYRSRYWYRNRYRWDNYRPPYRPPYRPGHHRPPTGHRPTPIHRPPTGGHRPPTGEHRPPVNHRPAPSRPYPAARPEVKPKPAARPAAPPKTRPAAPPQTRPATKQAPDKAKNNQRR